MAALYVRTRPVHQRVVAQLGLLDPDLSMERLRAVITRFFAFWSTNAPRPEAGAAMIGASVMESSARDDTTILAVYRSAPD
jgi:hypothetical protein